ncbi:hypothetical protein GIB67_008256 [Kingdonia uniflora]|uniref:Membrane-associated kinase regulator 6 n=1 Tax=Kingdonia uniflora TaxID=39325 RepID=A0A7J7N4S8_9MAGN|nr:hypothetical protein GIB67_008256 [Kingdonia uniflora]
MEARQSLSIESFSYSWLLNTSDDHPYIEMDPKLTASKRFLRNYTSSQDFNFDLPIFHQQSPLVHADELFSNGLLVPLFLSQSKINPFDVSESVSTSPVSSESLTTAILPIHRVRCPFMKRCRKLSTRLLRKYLCFLIPLYQKIYSKNMSTIRPESGVAKPDGDQQIMAFSQANWCHMDNSIHEAILHCRKSCEF